MNLFITRLFDQPALFFAWIMLVAFSICVHEFMHAYTAHRCGDDTAADRGHLTLNPLVQMGPVSLVMLLVIGIAWGAVPVDERNMRKSWHPAWVSFAGPLSNLVLCLVFGLASRFFAGDAVENLRFIFYVGSVVNGALFLLNMLPIPPLDGWGVLSGLIPRLKGLSPAVVHQMSWILLLLILFSPLFSHIWTGGEWMASWTVGR